MLTTPYRLLFVLHLCSREKDRVPSVLDMINYSQRARDILDKLKEFMKEHVYPVEQVRKNNIGNYMRSRNQNTMEYNYTQVTFLTRNLNHFVFAVYILNMPHCNEI